jgi:hypothetical protein
MFTCTAFSFSICTAIPATGHHLSSPLNLNIVAARHLLFSALPVNFHQAKTSHFVMLPLAISSMRMPSSFNESRIYRYIEFLPCHNETAAATKFFQCSFRLFLLQ